MDEEERAAVLDRLIGAGQKLHDRVSPDDVGQSVEAMERWDQRVKSEAPWLCASTGRLTSYPAFFERGYYLNGTTTEVNATRVKRDLSVRLDALLAARHGLNVARTAVSRPVISRKVFIIHGRSDAMHKVVRFLNKATDGKPIVLGEQPTGQVIIEALEEIAASASFAVALMTGDDAGGLSGSGISEKRARQNVIFELGFFLAALGRSRVQILYEDDVERPSDLDGVLYTLLDAGGAWKLSLGKRLAEAGFTVDLNRA